MALSRTIIKDQVPVHEVASEDSLRPLDATEHNMEPLNAKTGSGRPQHFLDPRVVHDAASIEIDVHSMACTTRTR